MKKMSIALSSSILVTGCASNPPLELSYYHARTSVSVEVTAFVGCTAGKNPFPVATFGFVPKSRDFADVNDGKETFDTSGLSSNFSNSDYSITLSPDGRLKGFNSSTTGTGSKILKAAKSFIDAAAPGTFAAPRINEKKVCSYVAAKGGKSKLLSLKYVGQINPSPSSTKSEGPIPLSPDDPTRVLTAGEPELTTFMGELSISAKKGQQRVVAPVSDYTLSGFSDIKLRQPGYVTVSVNRKTRWSSRANRARVIWSEDFLASQYGIPYKVPVPKSAFFGKRTFAMTLDDNGALTSLKYTDESGLEQALGSATELIDLVDGQSIAEKTAELKAKNDYYKELERTAQCALDRTKC